MILIFSDIFDHTTTKVCEWLRFYKADFLRINREDDVKFISWDFQADSILVSYKNSVINTGDISCVWYRRGGLPHNIKIAKLQNDFNYLLEDGNIIKTKVLDEFNLLINNVQRKMESNKSVGNYFNSRLNKLKVLQIAKESDLIIPMTYIVTNKIDLQKILENHKVVTKAITESVYEFTNNFAYYTYTEEITHRDIKNLHDVFPPSLIQVKIDKEFEIRSFYLRGKFYSMAIFSQYSDETKTDFRKSSSKNPNRFLPYKLPDWIEDKLLKVFEELQLNTGSVDLIYSTSHEYIFLEINPVGQFSMTSLPCNYNLEKIMAEELIKISSNENKETYTQTEC